MELYIKVSFTISIIGLVLHAVVMSFVAYPRRVEYSVGMDVFRLIATCGWCVWGAYLLWGAA